MPSTIGELTAREVPLLREDEPVRSAVERIVEVELPALPVADSAGRLVGIFGEREFIGAIFPGYLGQLSYAGFVNERLEQTLDKRGNCIREPVSKYMTTDHVDVGSDYSDAQVAETFLHHRVLIVPVIRDDQVVGVITRWDFFKALVERTLANEL